MKLETARCPHPAPTTGVGDKRAGFVGNGHWCPLPGLWGLRWRGRISRPMATSWPIGHGSEAFQPPCSL
jgi:hypothetical protein